MNSTPRFLSVDDVVALHAIGIADQGGDPHLRDRGLLESAVATPAQQIGGEYLHGDVPTMAAAYAFHNAGTIRSSMATSVLVPLR